jgi:uncharacterized membrane protein
MQKIKTLKFQFNQPIKPVQETLSASPRSLHNLAEPRLRTASLSIFSSLYLPLLLVCVRHRVETDFANFAKTSSNFFRLCLLLSPSITLVESM